MLIENPSIKDLEARLKAVRTYKFDGKNYMTTGDLAIVLGIPRELLDKCRKRYSNLIKPELMFGTGKYYSVEKARRIYAVFHLKKPYSEHHI